MPNRGIGIVDVPPAGSRLTRRTAFAGAVAAPLLAACAARAGEPQGYPVTFSDALDGPLLAERAWLIDPTLTAVRFDHDALHLRSSADRTAFVRARFLRPAPDVSLRETSEHLDWRCRVEPTGAFFLVVDAEFGGGPLRIQVVPYGAHVSV